MRKSKKDKLRQTLIKIRGYILLIISVFLIISLIRNISRIKKSEERIIEARKRVENLEEQKEELEKRLEYSQSDIYLEKQLRDGLGLAREDEIVIILPEDEILRRIAPDIQENESEEHIDANWKKWLNLFVMLE